MEMSLTIAVIILFQAYLILSGFCQWYSGNFVVEISFALAVIVLFQVYLVLSGFYRSYGGNIGGLV